RHGVGEGRIAQRVREDGEPGFRQSGVTADMVRVCAGIDDVTRGKRSYFFDRRQNAVRGALGSRIDKHHAVDADLNGDVSTGSGNHVEVRPNLYHVQITARLLRMRERDCGTNNQKKSGQQSSKIY